MMHTPSLGHLTVELFQNIYTQQSSPYSLGALPDDGDCLQQKVFESKVLDVCRTGNV